MAHIQILNDGTASGRAQLLLHLQHARTEAERIGDQAAAILIEMLQGLYPSRAQDEHDPRAWIAPVSASAPLKVFFFGTFQTFLGTSPVLNWRKKSQAVLQYLVMHRAMPVHRDQLLTLFWPDADPRSGRNSLNVTLHALRRALESSEAGSAGDELLQFTDEHYHFGSALQVWTDIDMFAEHVLQAQAAKRTASQEDVIAHYQAAAQLYRGDFLQEFRYEDWTLGYRERLQTTYMEVLSDLSQLYTDTGEYQRALDCSRKLLERDTCFEEAHCQMMRCYAALGQRSLALRQYTIGRETLARELGIEPLESTTRLYEQIKLGT